jgi:hypothetical protein
LRDRVKAVDEPFPACHGETPDQTVARLAWRQEMNGLPFASHPERSEESTRGMLAGAWILHCVQNDKLGVHEQERSDEAIQRDCRGRLRLPRNDSRARPGMKLVSLGSEAATT